MAVAGAVKLGWIKQSKDGMFAKDQVPLFYGPYSYDIYSYGLYSYGVYSYGIVERRHVRKGPGARIVPTDLTQSVDQSVLLNSNHRIRN